MRRRILTDGGNLMIWSQLCERGMCLAMMLENMVAEERKEKSQEKRLEMEWKTEKGRKRNSKVAGQHAVIPIVVLGIQICCVQCLSSEWTCGYKNFVVALKSCRNASGWMFGKLNFQLLFQAFGILNVRSIQRGRICIISIKIVGRRDKLKFSEIFLTIT